MAENKRRNWGYFTPISGVIYGRLLTTGGNAKIVKSQEKDILTYCRQAGGVAGATVQRCRR